MKAISILGSTGSIGCNTIRVVEHLGDIRVVGLGAGRNVSELARQAATVRPEIISVADEAAAEQLLRELHKLSIKPPRIDTGEAGLAAVATHPAAETVVSATVGAAGFVPTLRALEAGKRVALANKETLVMAGEMMTAAAAKSGALIIPIDSEHNAIHQCLRGEKRGEVRRLILTASGGPFLNRSAAEIEKASISDALDHPNWKMGDKITIDSATLMNKGFEVIEARWLFEFDPEQIAVVVHPQSVIHSMVEMIDGSIKAQLGVTDMRHAIQYALTFPDRKPSCLESLDFTSLSRLTFEPPDDERFPCLTLAYAALRSGGSTPTALNAANEVAVEAFLAGQIRLPEIAKINELVMTSHRGRPARTLADIISVDTEARTEALSMVGAKTDSAARQTV